MQSIALETTQPKPRLLLILFQEQRAPRVWGSLSVNRRQKTTGSNLGHGSIIHDILLFNFPINFSLPASRQPLTVHFAR